MHGRGSRAHEPGDPGIDLWTFTELNPRYRHLDFRSADSRDGGPTLDDLWSPSGGQAAHRLLLHQRHMGAQPRRAEAADVDAVHEDLACMMSAALHTPTTAETIKLPERCRRAARFLSQTSTCERANSEVVRKLSESSFGGPKLAQNSVTSGRVRPCGGPSSAKHGQQLANPMLAMFLRPELAGTTKKFAQHLPKMAQPGQRWAKDGPMLAQCGRIAQTLVLELVGQHLANYGEN